MRILNVYKGLNKDMYILALYRLISGMGYFVIPYLSLFLTNELTISVIVAGSIVAGANFLCIPTLYISGRITEKIGPKKTIIISQILAAMSYILVVICPVNYIKVCFAVLRLCFASVVVPAMDAWATIKNPDEDRRKAFSLLYLSQNIGFAIGSLIIGVAYKTNPNLVFIGDAITTLLAVGMIYVCTEKTDTEVFCEGAVQTGRKDIKINKAIKIFMLIILLNALAYGQLTFMLPLFLEKVATSGTILYGFIMAINAILVITLSPIFTEVLKETKLIDVLILSELLFAIGYGAYTFAHRNTVLLMITIVWSVGEVLFSINHMAYIVHNVEEAAVPRVTSMAASFNKAGGILSSIIGGALVSGIGFSKSWTCISLLVFVSTGMGIYIKKLDK